MGIKVVDLTSGNLRKVAGFGYTNVRVFCGAFVFSGPYTEGGEPCAISDCFSSLLGVVIEPKDGYVFTYNQATGRVVAYNTTPSHSHELPFAVAQEEVVPVVDNVGLILNKAALVQSVTVTVGGSPGPRTIVGASDMPLPGQVSVNLLHESGGTLLAFAQEDAVTEARVTYLALPSAVSDSSPLHGSEVASGTDLSLLGVIHWFAWGT
ncbi:MAG TPA: hypothetical protein GX512_03770 [Firmicutes bacterium]|nr:hypothetical protein [Candidatus Fermentithermobacillaceae bacterium]